MRVFACVLVVVCCLAYVQAASWSTRPPSSSGGWPTSAGTTTRAPTTTTTTSAPQTTTRAPTTTTTSAPGTTTTSAPQTTTRAPTTTTTTTRSATTSSSADPLVAAILDGHNAARALVKASNLKWNDTIANVAVNYAKGCTWGHNGNRGPYGENIYASSGEVSSTSGKDATNSWVGEKADYTCATNVCASGKVCGHYTQVIWAATTDVGCGAVTCKTGSPFGSSFPTWTYVVCDYGPPGNYVGQAPVPAANC